MLIIIGVIIGLTVTIISYKIIQYHRIKRICQRFVEDMKLLKDEKIQTEHKNDGV